MCNQKGELLTWTKQGQQITLGKRSTLQLMHMIKSWAFLPQKQRFHQKQDSWNKKLICAYKKKNLVEELIGMHLNLIIDATEELENSLYSEIETNSS